jgi:helix-turn-helix protein
LNERAPLRARLHWYRLSTAEFAVLTAMAEHCSDGSCIWASVARLAAYSKLSERTVQKVLRDLCSCGILTRFQKRESDKENPWRKRRPATYRINEAAMEDDPKMRPYFTRQRTLPGIFHSSADEGATGVTVAGEPVQRLRLTGAVAAPDSRSTSDSNPLEIQHGDAALNAMPAWLSFKEQLRSELSEEEWNLWVRPMFLLRVLPAGSEQKHLLAALPRNGRIQAAASRRQPLMRELLAPAGFNISLTRYPDEWEIQEAQSRFGVDLAPKPWTRASS